MNASSNLQELPQPGSAGDLPTVGQILRGVREQNGLTIDQIANYLKLSPRQINALEEDAYEQLPGITFIRGFIRSYGRVLNLDPQALLDRFVLHSAVPAAAPRVNEQMPGGSSRAWQMWLIPVALAIILFFTAYHEREKSRAKATDSPRPAPVAGAQADADDGRPIPSVAPSEPGADALAAGTAQSVGAMVVTDSIKAQPSASSKSQPANANETGSIEFTFRDLAWVEVRDQTGQMIISGSNPAGTKQVAQGKVPLSVVIGNADEVKVSYNGKPIDLTPYVRQNVARLTLN